jgi:hypothetical protein
VPTSSSTIAKTQTLSGILVYDVAYMQTKGYQYLAPVADADFPMQ